MTSYAGNADAAGPEEDVHPCKQHLQLMFGSCALPCNSHSRQSLQLICFPFDHMCCNIAIAVAGSLRMLLLVTCVLHCSKQPLVVSSYAVLVACLLEYSEQL